MTTLHYLNDSRAHRVLWMLEEIGADYEIQVWQRDKKTMLAPPEAKAVHALGKFPILEVDGLVLAESGAIVDFLADKYGALKPTEADAHEQYRYWLHYAEGSLMPPLLISLMFSKIKEKAPFFVRPLAMFGPNLINKAYLKATLDTHMGFVESHLARHDWFAGPSFSAADIQMSFPLEASLSRVPGNFPAIGSWVKRIQTRPAYGSAVERAGVPYRYAD